MISEKVFKHFLILSFFTCMLAFSIGQNWHYKEMNRLEYAGEIAFWTFANAAEHKMTSNSFSASVILWDIDNALKYQQYSNAPEEVINQLKQWRDSLTYKNQNTNEQ